MLRQAVPLLLLLILALSTGYLNPGVEEKAREAEPLPDQNPGTTQVQPGQQTTSPVEYPTISSVQVSSSENQSDFPALAFTSSGNAWAAWLEWDGKDSDQIVIRNLSWDSKRPSLVLKDGQFSHHGPALAARGNRVLCVWTSRVGEDWELFGTWVEEDGTARTPARLTRIEGSDLSPRLAAAVDGTITMVWQGFRNGRSDIFARRFQNERWGNDLRISPSGANDWYPVVAADSAGRVYVVWDSYETGDYNVYGRRLERDRLGPVIPIAISPEAEFHASVACDRQDRLWVAYDLAGENWGKDFSRGSAAAAPGSAGLHHARQIGMRVYTREGLTQPAHDLSTIFKERMARFAELASLDFDGEGQLWVVFRHWTNSQPTENFHFYATRLSGAGWDPPARLQNSSGRNSQRASLARGKDGLLRVVYSSDGRDDPAQRPDPVKARLYRIHSATLPARAATAIGSLRSVEPEKPRPAVTPRSRYTTVINGIRYELLYGDLHRHTDIRGHSAVDGSVLDSYRYALDAAELDFLGVSDHSQAAGGRWQDGLRDYQWWWTQKVADMFSNPPAFSGLYAYEHSLGTPSGHRNIVFLRRGAPLRLVDRERVKEDNLPPRLWEWMLTMLKGAPAQKSVIIPHTFAEATQARGLWDWENPEFEPLLEIYQGARSSYETVEAERGAKRGQSQLKEAGSFAQDALNKGYRYGFIASSDHGSTHNSYACLYVREASRTGIMEAMLARRAFAASDDIILDTTLNEHAMGEEFELEGAPQLKIYVRARNDIVRIDVVRDGKFIYTVPGQGRVFRGTYQDAEVSPGKHYYYVRVIQKDVEAPEGDPEMAWGSPFFVTVR